MAYLSSRVLPEEKAAAQKIRHKALNYQMKNGVLYRLSFLGPLLRCVDAEDANYLIREVHEDICGLHMGPRMVIAKLMNAGYYWSGMHMDVKPGTSQIFNCVRLLLHQVGESQTGRILWEFIICHFGLPQELVSDNGTQFADSGLQEWLKEL
ncbi:uncharacterized protein LOC143569955 [Bidens hawaiensis]|uniref:uncharacterized protein LOC143569955 n=1 Tax=Bidens hawaiensis TaxID=980011 RepID=UPI00404AAACC